MEWIVEAETLSDFIHGRYTLSTKALIRCKDCKYFEYDHLYIVQGIPVIGHLVCNKWGDGCRTDENGFCFMGERRTDEPD